MTLHRSQSTSTLLVLLLCATLARGQGRTDTMNVESPLVHPLEVALIDGHAWLLVANTPDSSLEVWDTDETRPAAERLAARVRVGQEPVSVRWHPGLQRAYTANFLGDSVSIVALASDGEGGLRATFELTRPVGDEPLDVAFDPDSPTLFVSLGTRHGLSRRHALSLAPVGADDGFVPLVDASVSPARSVREPHVVLQRADALLTLGFKGGHGPIYDLDLLVTDLDGVPRHALSGFGTTNWSMALANDGSLFVAGAEARNDLATEPAVAAAPTGFVESRLVRVDDPLDARTVVDVRDLNALRAGPVARDDALCMPTDVVVFEPHGGTRKVFVAAYGSDRVGVVEPEGEPADWAVRRIDVAPPDDSPVAARGPRALALKDASPLQARDPGARLYVLGRFTHDVTIIDPVGERVLETFALAHDPTPEYIQRGRPWIYSARLTSGNGFVSCASCHTDGRTDGLVWNLGTPGAPRPPFPLALVSGLPGDQFEDGDCDDDNSLLFDDFVANGFPPKFGMLTQSLQGLMNFEVDIASDTTAFFTNASYHWRADRPGLASFNAAFVGLLGLDPQPGTVDQGLPPKALSELVEFVNSIHYPPNPLQPIARVYEGSLGDPDDPLDGEGSLAGLEIFHTAPMAGLFGLSCVGCHQLPEASDNRITVMADPLLFFQPLETAALRGLLQKEVRVDEGPAGVGEILLGESGLTHSGGDPTIVDFDLVFSDDLGGHGPQPPLPDALVALNTFVRGLDWGAAPVIGHSLTIGRRNAADASLSGEFALLEGQALLANAGLVARAHFATTTRGFWFDVSSTPPVYREEPAGLALSRQQLLALTLGTGRLVLEAVPLGSERRLAASSFPRPLAGRAPSDVVLLPMVTNTAYAPIPMLRKNVSPFESPELAFTWTNPCALTPRGPKALRLMQWGLLQDGAPEGAFGLPGLRHEAPRRLRLAARDLRHGATLHLFMPYGEVAPGTTGPLVPSAARELVLNLHATGERLGGRVVWETAVELDPLTAYALMLGGPSAPGVAAAAYDTFDALPEPPLAGTFDPLAWNWYWVAVRNADGGMSQAGWQRLTISP